MDLHKESDNIDHFALMTIDQADDNVVLPIELTNTTGTCLQQLNTHCLMEIFSSNSLTLTDLCSIAETCTRFKEITEMIFPKDLYFLNAYNGDCTLYLNYLKKDGQYWCSIPCSMQVLERILKNFGPYVSGVLMNGEKLLKPVEKYWDTAKLRGLHIFGFKSGRGKGLTMKLKSILQWMLSVSFDDCDLMTLVPCPYINWDSLIELEITSSTGCVAILRNTFPKLETFSFYKNNTMFSKSFNENFSEILPNFLQRHKHLRTLHLSSDSVCCSTSQLMETIANNCTELTNLTLERCESPNSSFNFSNLKNLRKLSMLTVQSEVLKSLTTLELINFEYVSNQLFNFLSQLPNLRELHLFYGDYDQIQWSRLTRLKELHIDERKSGYVGSHLPHIISELTNLEELVYRVDGQFELTSEEFSKIVKVVEGRPNKLTLRCHLSKNLAKNYVPNKNVNLFEY